MSIRKLPQELQDIAIKELNEVPSRIPNDLAYIKEWLTKQPHLKARTDDQFLIAFLRGTKYSLERTKEKLDMHYTLKTITPEIYKNRDPFAPEIQEILSLGAMIPLPKPPYPGGPRVLFMRNGLMEKHKLDQAIMFKVSTMIQDIMLLEDDNLGVSGVAGIQDMADVTIAFLKMMPISLTKKATMCFQHGYPHRIKGGHFINIPSVFEAIYSLFRPFLTEKLKKRMRIHMRIEDMFDTFPQEMLPEEYGGQAGKIQDIAAYWKAKVESYKDWFKEDENYGTDEAKRPGKPKTAESVFGLEGSFRQLAVD